MDHGKSTLIGRLLFDTKSVADGKAERIEAACRAEGMPFEYAFLLDALLEEQAQNVTMDTTRVPFRTARRAFTIIDAPGHKEFLKHMITGAAHADAAVLLVDAHEGLREQTRRHAYLLSLLGLRQVVVAVNKMDLVEYSEAAFTRIRNDITNFLGGFGLAPSAVVPLAAKHGHGLLEQSPLLPWYIGPALLPALEALAPTPAPHGAPLRLTVQDIYRFDERRIVAGFVESGRIAVGSELAFFPGGKRSRVKSIERWPTSLPGAAGISVEAGHSVALTLEDEIFVERGHVGASPDAAPAEAYEFTARIFWLHPEPLRVGESLPLRLGTQHAEVRVVAIARVLDAVTLENSEVNISEVKNLEVAEVRLRARRKLAFDPGAIFPATGRFILQRARRIAGGGVIDAAVEEKRLTETRGSIASSARTAHLGHRGAILWLTGLSGSGKSTLSAALELELFRVGVLPVVLDGDILRTGLCRGLGFSQADRSENIRRAAEAAVLLAETGAVVITALISPFRDDRRAAADLAQSRGIPFAEIYVNAPLAECERRDPKSLYKKARAGQIASFTGIDSPYEAPLSADLELHTDRETIEESVKKLAQLAVTLARPA